METWTIYQFNLATSIFILNLINPLAPEFCFPYIVLDLTWDKTPIVYWLIDAALVKNFFVDP